MLFGALYVKLFKFDLLSMRWCGVACFRADVQNALVAVCMCGGGLWGGDYDWVE